MPLVSYKNSQGNFSIWKESGPGYADEVGMVYKYHTQPVHTKCPFGFELKHSCLTIEELAILVKLIDATIEKELCGS